MSRNLRFSGLTLLETLISIAILAAILAALSLTVFQTRLLDEKTSAILDSRQRTRILMNLIETDFQTAVFLTEIENSLGGSKNESGIIGISAKETETPLNQIYMHVHQKSRLVERFERVIDPEIHEISYFLKKNEKDEFFSLYRGEKFYVHQIFEKISPSNINSILSDTLTRSNILLSSVVISFQCEYLIGKNSSGEDNYLDEWDSDPNSILPEAVRITLKTSVRNNEEKQVLIVNIRPKLANAQWKI